MPNNLNEMFSLPIGLKLVAKIGGLKLFSSGKLKAKFKKAMLATKRFKGSSKIESLIDNNLILPCYLTKGVVGFTFYKIFASKGKQSICGFFSPDTKRIYILISNNTIVAIYSNNKKLAKLLLHEGMHKYFDQNPSECHSLFKSELEDFYINYIDGIVGEFIPNKKNIQILGKKISDMTYKFETAKTIDQKMFLKYVNEIRDMIFKVSDKSEEVQEIIDKHKLMMLLYFTNSDRFFNNLNKFLYFFRAFYKAYKKTFKSTDTNTLPIQELFFCSEVIAIGSELSKSPKYSKTFEKIKG